MTNSADVEAAMKIVADAPDTVAGFKADAVRAAAKLLAANLAHVFTENAALKEQNAEYDRLLSEAVPSVPANADEALRMIVGGKSDMTDDERKAAQEKIATMRSGGFITIPAGIALPEKMTPAIAEVMGRPAHLCTGMALDLRKLGHKIDYRTDKEQAAVLWFLLPYAMQYGGNWSDVVKAYFANELAKLPPAPSTINSPNAQ